MRKSIVAGNWKMNCSLSEAKKLASEIVNMVRDEVKSEAEIVLCPPFIYLIEINDLIGSSANISLGAQNCHQEESGAFTGEISADMLTSLGSKYVILGHSERREYFGESDELLEKKIKHALNKDLLPIFCCGEKPESREANDQEVIVSKQIEKALFSLSADEIQKVVIAYEPVWAIGTGKTASAEQAQEMHAFIRSKISEKYGKEARDGVSILYGGSVKPGNAQEIFSQPDIDGGLIGGASLKSRDFTDIVKAIG
ncbi:MAG: triose-phosphate isomerase [Ekhidna sp.]|nr:triose-phosphate isomerase [Ekhidna sp.]